MSVVEVGTAPARTTSRLHRRSAMPPLSLLPLVLLYLAVFGLFGWGLACYFKPVPGAVRPPGLRLIKAGGLAGVAVQLVGLCRVPAESPATVAAAMLLLGLAAVIFGAARRAHRDERPGLAFTSAVPAQLVVAGPYRWVRHPFYLSYLLGWTGGAVAAPQPWGTLPVPVMAALYYAAARDEERRLLASPLGDAYRRYQAASGMFLPRLTGRVPAAQG